MTGHHISKVFLFIFLLYQATRMLRDCGVCTQASQRAEVTPRLVDLLEGIAGKENVSTAQSVREHHGRDESSFPLVIKCTLHKLYFCNYLKYFLLQFV